MKYHIIHLIFLLTHSNDAETVGTPWTNQLSRPYLGLWDPNGLLGRFLKPAENLYQLYKKTRQ